MATGASTQTAHGAAPSPTGESLIELAGVGRFFPAGGGVHALADVTLGIGRGEFVCVMGPSGSGKSTLMNILGCLDRATSGRYLLRGRAVDDLHPDELAALRRDVFGFVFQSYNLIGSASAEENVELPATYAGRRRAERVERARRLLRSLGLGHRLRHRPGALSGGEQQRVAIARALMNGGQVLLADEPTGALDAASGTEVMSTLRGLAERGHTVVVITHDPDVAAWAWRRIELRDGRVVADTGPAFAPPETDGALDDSPSPTPGTRAPAPAEVPGQADTPPTPHPDTLLPDARWRTRLATAGEELGTGVRSLRANLLRASRLRTVLTMLSVTVGVWAVVALLSVVQGAYQQGVRTAASTGADTIFVGAAERVGNRPVTPARLTLADVEALKQLPTVRAASPSISRRMTIRRADRDLEAPLYATTVGGMRAENRLLARGAIWTEAEADGLATVAVIGAHARDKLLPAPLPAVGEYILVADVPFLVKGVLARVSPPGRIVWDDDKDVLVPLKTALALWFQDRGLDSIQVAAADPLRVRETGRAVFDTLTRRHGDAGVRLTNLAGLHEGLSTIEKLLSTLIGTVGGVSLVVGGLGVMSVMLIAVAERRREIGIRMATGARRRDIARQFLLEAAVVTCAGGLLGTTFGAVTGPALAAAGLPVAFSPWFVAAALACSIGTGVAAGFAPARRAAMLDPVRALAR